MERPRVGPDEVLVRVVVARTYPVDAKFRADGSCAGIEPPVVLGSDVSGVVEEVGAGVSDLATGDEVYYTPEIFGPGSNDGYAEYRLARADIVAKKPGSVSHEEAAAVPLAGRTAYEALVRRLAGRVGETVPHRATYNAEKERIKMWLDAEAAQRPRTPHLEANFDKGEGVRTEISTKSTPESAVRTFEEAGLNLLDLYTDDRNLFSLTGRR